MPNAGFLEQYPLYRKFTVDDLPSRMDRIQRVPIKMSCSICKSEQTFLMTNDPYENCEHSYSPSAEVVFRAVYTCAHCAEFTRVFFIRMGEDCSYMMKVGQYPAWDIQGDPNIERLLGSHSALFKKGLICESQGYGIGAFAYYRRIVEEIIDELLGQISDLMSGEELEGYKRALEATKRAVAAQEKIALVKDMLPAILRPDGMNPLSALHSILSEGLHSETDDECLEKAMRAREVLIFLACQIAVSKAASKGFTKSMRKLLGKKKSTS